MRAIYAFSGDPITYGHIDIVQRAARTYDEVVVAIGGNPEKADKYLFSRAERLDMAKRSLEHIPNVNCVTFPGLLGEYAYRHGFDVIVRGVRNNSDLEGELVLFAVIQSLHPTVDTVFLPTRPQLSHISSGIVKAIVSEGGDVSEYCPLCVKEELEKRLLGKFFLGIAGGIAAGKSHFAERLVHALQKKTSASYISLDAIGHYVLADADGAIYRETRRRIAAEFGEKLRRPDGSIDRKALGRIVFAQPPGLGRLNNIMREPMLTRLYEETRKTPGGVTLIEGAILVEACWTKLVNNNVILVDAPEKLRLERLLERGGITEDEARAKIRRQPAAAERKAILEGYIREHNWGRIWEIHSDGRELDCENVAAEILELCP